MVLEYECRAGAMMRQVWKVWRDRGAGQAQGLMNRAEWDDNGYEGRGGEGVVKAVARFDDVMCDE